MLNKVRHYGSNVVHIPLILKWLCVIVFVSLCFVPFTMARNFAEFSINIPDDWSVTTQSNTHTLADPKEHCSINITVAPNQGASFNEMAILLYQSMQGKSPKGDDDGFSFLIDTKSDVLSAARFTYVQEKLVFVIASGACNNFQNIVSSLKVNGSTARPYPFLVPEQNIATP